MVEVKFWEAASQRKKGENPIGVFTIPFTPDEIPEVSEELKGKTDRDGNDLYELAVARRKERVEKAILDCKFKACDKVREIVGSEGVLVANIVEEEEET